MNTYCVLDIGDRRIGFPMEHVREIIEQRHIEATVIPLAPAFVLGLFNLRGQVLPHLDLRPFIGAAEATSAPGADERTVIVERGALRFALTGARIDTEQADPTAFEPPAHAAMYPALEAEAPSPRGNFDIIHLDRLEASLAQAMKRTETAAEPAIITTTPTSTAAPELPPNNQDLKPI